VAPNARIDENRNVLFKEVGNVRQSIPSAIGTSFFEEIAFLLSTSLQTLAYLPRVSPMELDDKVINVRLNYTYPIRQQTNSRVDTQSLFLQA
jgi:hypothetical protein